MEEHTGFEPVNGSFADFCLTTWLMLHMCGVGRESQTHIFFFGWGTWTRTKNYRLKICCDTYFTIPQYVDARVRLELTTFGL